MPTRHSGAKRRRPRTTGARARSPAALAALPDAALLEAVQRQTFRFFWEGADPASALAPDRRNLRTPGKEELVAIGGSGFAVMALIVAAERGWVARAAVLQFQPLPLTSPLS